MFLAAVRVLVKFNFYSQSSTPRELNLIKRTNKTFPKNFKESFAGSNWVKASLKYVQRSWKQLVLHVFVFTNLLLASLCIKSGIIFWASYEFSLVH